MTHFSNSIHLNSKPHLSFSSTFHFGKIQSKDTPKDHLYRLSEQEHLIKKSQLQQQNSEHYSQSQPQQWERHLCPICQGTLLQQISQQIQYWHCSDCHTRFNQELIADFVQHDQKQQDYSLRYFKNQSPFIKILRFEDRVRGFQERVVFPGETVVLNLAPQGLVRVKSSESVTNLNVDTVPSDRLPQVDLGRHEWEVGQSNPKD